MKTLARKILNREIQKEARMILESICKSNHGFDAFPDASFGMKSIAFQSVHLWFIPIDYEWMNAKSVSERTDSFVVKVRMTSSDYDSFFFSLNWCLKFNPNDCAPIRTKFSFRLNPFNIAQIHSEWYRSIPRFPCHYTLSPNDFVAHSNGLVSEWFGNKCRIHTESFSFRMSPKLVSGLSRY